ncbi:hypothetical protein DENIT_80266 [Pseudomonas veronii]|uniref:hypothetical protein n=1 Tax=Pseudomonas veronii TaxID=76761 RepID=UPI00174FCE04|nr:hypothetical protein [Pseudomonas veronii]CAD0266349.1 hypothetical protein DENIT_80266 [Pseudomonas veronii]
MFLKNEAARLITINHLVDGVETSYPILPGENPAVKVPDSVADIEFVAALLTNRDLRQLSSEEVAALGEVDGDEEGADGIEALREQAGRAGVRVNKT